MACGRGKGGAVSSHGTAAARTGSGLRSKLGEGGAGPWPGFGWAGPVGEKRVFLNKDFHTNQNKQNKIYILYRHIIYPNFQKKIFYDMNIFIASNKVHTNSNK